MTPEKIYAITVIGSICALLNLIGCIALVLVVAFLFGGLCIDETRTLCFILAKRCALVAGVSLIFACFVPFKKDLAAMYVLPYIEKNADAVCQLPDELAIAARAWLKNEATR